MKWPHWLEGCRGPYVAVSYVSVAKYQGVGNVEDTLGDHTRPIAKCSTCGKLFATNTLPGKLSLEELKNL